MIIPPCPGTARNEVFGNFSHVNVGKEPKSRTQNDNMNRKQGTSTAKKEDDTDSTATETTADFSSVCESKWDDYTTEGLVETTTLNDQTYVSLWKRRCVKPAREWRISTSQVYTEEEQSKIQEH